ncbi:MAG: hypothetical protein ABFD89_16150 [Bryobacteraceae bacterium]
MKWPPVDLLECVFRLEQGATKNKQARVIPLAPEVLESMKVQRAGLWPGDKKTGEPSVLFHDLRRPSVRNLRQAGVPEKIAMEISGHKTRSVFDRYNIVIKCDLKDAAKRLGEDMANKGTHADDSAHYRHTIEKTGFAPAPEKASKLLI